MITGTGIRRIHFTGICGTAMGAVAAAMQEMGFYVAGSDQNVYPPMSTFLAERNVEVMHGYSERNLEYKPDLVVVGNAISRGNPEVEYMLEHKLRYCSLPELVREFFIQGKRVIVVAGTHGKTTTAALLAWVFDHNGLNPSYMIGGIPINFGQGARFTDSEWFIIEGDEYDTAFFDKRSKFVHYQPEIAIINNIEFDHADIFRDLAAVQAAFEQLIRLVPRNGLLLVNGDDPNIAPLIESGAAKHCPVKRFGLGPTNAIQAYNIKLAPTATEFEIPSYRFRTGLIGELNVRNALAVVACAKHAGLKNHQIQSAFDTFKGVRRRLEVRGIAGGVVVIDDFGHHPTAIRETLKALRVRYPTEKIWALFEPRSNTTRRNVFQAELAEALAGADSIVVAAVARAEQLAPELRLDPEKLAADLRAAGKQAVYLADPDTIAAHVARHAQAGDVVCVFSNGGFGGIHTKLLERLGRR
ncbi:MAG: UDP-N-acetylmuramate:L-alanyl-gamma-D-glutamyl-meso-diaminopimelate ligase [Verrucomicrobiae bacterium]|nr:UDP-N-acetylmuramate:L-alanyl-gamma-D-glutamyl-meso-diaminopimelate ligase [Verrucomicrobiae bacterium]